MLSNNCCIPDNEDACWGGKGSSWNSDTCGKFPGCSNSIADNCCSKKSSYKKDTRDGKMKNICESISPIPSTNYTIYKDWSGNDFIPKGDWDYYGKDTKRYTCGKDEKLTNDKTGSYCWYGSYDELLSVNDKNNFVIKCGGRDPDNNNLIKSIRINTVETYNSGLFIAKIDNIPEGNGIWPSWWLTAVEPKKSHWSCGGEIDIIEIVNSIKDDENSSHNISTLHTSNRPDAQPCILNPGTSNEIKCNNSTGDSTGCGCPGASDTRCPDIGCGIKSKISNSVGYGYNISNRGSIYACELTSDGKVNVWFFQSSNLDDKKIIQQIDENTIDISTWSSNLVADFTACPGQFKNLHMIFNIAICGSWAGRVFKGSTGSGCEQCNKYMDNNSSNVPILPGAYWEIDYVKIFK
tara:strand:- start:2680 stop:3900 length:1221 start_codon:yes stop_codon:yes gene_type:complete